MAESWAERAGVGCIGAGDVGMAEMGEHQCDEAPIVQGIELSECQDGEAPTFKIG